MFPPHLVRKWKREIEETVPGAHAAIVTSITDLERLRMIGGDGPLFAVMSRERGAKLSYRWQPAVVERWAAARGRLFLDEATGEPFRVSCCPDCHAMVLDRDGVPLTDRDLSRRRHTCNACGSALWQADNSGPRRYPLADYVKHRMAGFFDLLIGDEIHEHKSREARHRASPPASSPMSAAGHSACSGTLSGGYASTLFHLLYQVQHRRFGQRVRALRRAPLGRALRLRRAHHRQSQAIATTRTDGPAEGGATERSSARGPDSPPRALFHLIGQSIFLRLSDVASGLPPYSEEVLVSGMDAGARHRPACPSESAYEALFGDPQGRTRRRPRKEDRGACSPRTFKHSSRSRTGAPGAKPCWIPETGEVLAQVPPLSEDKLYPKEKALTDLVAAERLQGRRVLVYVTHTGTRDITGRMEDILTRHGFRTAVMKADAVAPDRREAWVADRVEEGIDVLICHPRLVQTGLDLIDFPTLVWFETDYSVYTMRQASRRSWRIGQTQPVRVVFMSYRNTLQADALKLVAKKLQSSLAVEGELPEDGLAAFGDDGDDLMMALARKIVSGEPEGAESVEDVFARALDAESEAEELLVDQDWRPVEIEPEAVPANGNGHHANGIGPTVELVPVNGHTPVLVNGDRANGHTDENEDPQQSLFPWAEFMAAEADKPKLRKCKPQPAMASLFEWALSLEQEGEVELVGAGR